MKRHLFIICILAISAYAGDVTDALALNRELVDIQAMEVKAREQWEEQRVLLLAQLEASKARLAKLQEKLQASKSETEQAQKTLSDEKDELKRLEEWRKKTTATINAATEELDSQWQSYPAPLQEKLSPLKKSVETKESLPERLHALFSIYQEIATFDANVHLTKELVPHYTNQNKMCDVIYVGLGAAYALAPNDELAGYGRPTPNGYEWRWIKGHKSEVKAAVEILQKQRNAKIIRLPLQK